MMATQNSTTERLEDTTSIPNRSQKRKTRRSPNALSICLEFRHALKGIKDTFASEFMRRNRVVFSAKRLRRTSFLQCNTNSDKYVIFLEPVETGILRKWDEDGRRAGSIRRYTVVICWPGPTF